MEENENVGDVIDYARSQSKNDLEKVDAILFTECINGRVYTVLVQSEIPLTPIFNANLVDTSPLDTVHFSSCASREVRIRYKIGNGVLY